MSGGKAAHSRHTAQQPGQLAPRSAGDAQSLSAVASYTFAHAGRQIRLGPVAFWIFVGSVVGTNEDEFVDVARILDRAGVSIVELNLADDYVTKSVAPFASFERLKSLLGRVRGETGCVLAVKVPARIPFEPRAIADLFKSMRIAIAVCANDLPKDLSVDIASGAVQGPARTLSQAHAFFKESESLLDVVAVGGINTGRDAYVAHLTGAKAVQVGSALMKEGAGALGRIDRELSLLGEHSHKSVSEIVGKVRFTE